VATPYAALGERRSEVFCGYHDLTPFSPNGARVLAHRVRAGARRPDPRRVTADVGFYERAAPSSSFRPLGSTRTWSWQLGARLRWDPSAPGERVLFNDVVDGRCGARLLETTGAQVKTFAVPLYDVAHDGQRALTLDFGRLQRLRPGYGYDLLGEHARSERAPASTGLDVVDLQTGETERVISLADAARVDPQPTMDDAEHYFNHASFSPDGRQIAVYHLWLSARGQRHVRLLLFDRDGRLVYYLPGQDHVSHMGWWGSDRIVAFARLPGHARPRYWVLALGERPEWRPVADGLTEDGHPTMHPFRDGLMLTDTYPDRNAERTLLLHDLHAGRTRWLGRFFSPPALARERRCDLHPRWSPDGRRVAVDSAHRRRREIVICDLSGLLSEDDRP
jgi:hypothetical protein